MIINHYAAAQQGAKMAVREAEVGSQKSEVGSKKSEVGIITWISANGPCFISPRFQTPDSELKTPFGNSPVSLSSETPIFRRQTSDFRLLTSDFRLQTSDLRKKGHFPIVPLLEKSNLCRNGLIPLNKQYRKAENGKTE